MVEGGPVPEVADCFSSLLPESAGVSGVLVVDRAEFRGVRPEVACMEDPPDVTFISVRRRLFSYVCESILLVKEGGRQDRKQIDSCDLSGYETVAKTWRDPVCPVFAHLSLSLEGPQRCWSW
jgi:hypothetical protein